VLDEVGRGTSTFDGMAIAQAIVEDLHDASRPGGPPKTIFATHYHELTSLASSLSRLRTYRVDVLERGDDVVFLHAVVEGGADRSYGVHVARLAGVPERVTRRAAELLETLESRR
jgi:DNA mismatch repair protein MutS